MEGQSQGGGGDRAGLRGGVKSKLNQTVDITSIQGQQADTTCVEYGGLNITIKFNYLNLSVIPHCSKLYSGYTVKKG
jgi:hypothetical protein